VIEQKTTFCRVCEAYCGLVATVEDGRITELRPDPAHVASHGYACPQGLAAHEVTHDPDRLLHPMKKVDGAWQRISWEQAIAEIALRLNRIRREHGPHAIALYVGNPAGYSYSHRIGASSWMGALGSRNSYGAGSQDNLADFLASKLLYGSFFLQPIPDVARTSFLLLVGTNPAVSQGTLVSMPDAKRRLRAIRARGGKVVVVDPRRSETARLATEHHFVRPDSDAFLLLAMIQTILAEGLEAREFVARHTAGVERLRAVTASFPPELAARRTGIDADTIRRLAREFARAPGACAAGRVVCGRFGTLAAWSLEVLNVVTGNLDRAGGSLFSEGIVDMVGLPSRVGLETYGTHRSRVGDHPGVLGELPAGVLAEEITTPGPGQVRALVVSAGNPVLSTAEGPTLAAAMAQLECTVALDLYLSETASLADYVLPCTTFFERDDIPFFDAQLMTDPFGQWAEALVPPQGEAKSEWEIYVRLSDAMGLPFLNSRLAAAGRRLLRLFGRDVDVRWLADAMVRWGPYGDRYLPWRRGVSLAELAKHPHGLELPALRGGILRRKLRTRDRKVHLWSSRLDAEIARLRRAAEEPDDLEYPLRLIGRRDMRSNNSWLHNVPRLMRGDRCHRLRVHPDDAARIGLADGGRAVVRSPFAALEVDVRVTDEVMPGVVSLPHGWGHTYPTGTRVATRDPGANCNALIDRRAIEPLSGMAFLNGFPVAVERAPGHVTP
jgi:anaerobic selenocysteine-containing dehydrogenase